MACPECKSLNVRRINKIKGWNLEGNKFFWNVGRQFKLPNEHLGVPMLIVGETVLIGSHEIPQQFPGIIENGFATGGIGWPDILGLDQIIEDETMVESTKNKTEIEPNLDNREEENKSNTNSNAARCIYELT